MLGIEKDSQPSRGCATYSLSKSHIMRRDDFDESKTRLLRGDYQPQAAGELLGYRAPISVVSMDQLETRSEL